MRGLYRSRVHHTHIQGGGDDTALFGGVAETAVSADGGRKPGRGCRRTFSMKGIPLLLLTRPTIDVCVPHRL